MLLNITYVVVVDFIHNQEFWGLHHHELINLASKRNDIKH